MPKSRALTVKNIRDRMYLRTTNAGNKKMAEDHFYAKDEYVLVCGKVTKNYGGDRISVEFTNGDIGEFDVNDLILRDPDVEKAEKAIIDYVMSLEEDDGVDEGLLALANDLAIARTKKNTPEMQLEIALKALTDIRNAMSDIRNATCVPIGRDELTDARKINRRVTGVVADALRKLGKE